MLYNTDTEVYVRTPKLAKKVFKRLYKRQGWDRRFADNVTPFVNYRAPGEGDAHYEEFKATGRVSYKNDFSKEGGWFAAVPIDYLSQLDDEAAMCFDLEDKPR